MVYLKAALAGVVWAVLFALVALAIIVLWVVVVARAEGSGGMGAVSVASNWAIPFAFMGFAVGFLRTLRSAA